MEQKKEPTLTSNPLTNLDIAPLLSVVVPTCHRNEWLARCLQELSPFNKSNEGIKYEVIVTDDGRNSSAKSMIESRFPWAKWTAGPRRGPAANRNHGVTQASGAWIVFVDDDCIPSKGFLYAYLEALDNSSVLEGKTISNDLPGNDPRFEAPVNLTGGNLFSCNFCVSKGLFKQLGGFDERFRFWCEDIDFLRRVTSKGMKIHFVESAVVDHPCRLRPVGIAMGKRWYGIVDLWCSERKKLSWWIVLSHTAKIRLPEIVRVRGWARIPFTFMLALELITVAVCARTWIQDSTRLFETDWAKSDAETLPT